MAIFIINLILIGEKGKIKGKLAILIIMLPFHNYNRGFFMTKSIFSLKFYNDRERRQKSFLIIMLTTKGILEHNFMTKSIFSLYRYKWQKQANSMAKSLLL